MRSGANKCFSPEERSQAVRELCNRRGTARKVAQSIGVSVPVLYKWKKDLILGAMSPVKYRQHLGITT
ncbi:transposase [Klebsiella aerogenes]